MASSENRSTNNNPNNEKSISIDDSSLIQNKKLLEIKKKRSFSDNTKFFVRHLPRKSRFQTKTVILPTSI